MTCTLSHFRSFLDGRIRAEAAPVPLAAESHLVAVCVRVDIAHTSVLVVHLGTTAITNILCAARYPQVLGRNASCLVAHVIYLCTARDGADAGLPRIPVREHRFTVDPDEPIPHTVQSCGPDQVTVASFRSGTERLDRIAVLPALRLP